MSDAIRVKKRCCKDTPRCKRCPVVWKRLSRAGLAERESHRVYVPADELKKRHIKAARH
ncbi:MAG: hypothetical protein JWM73_997 [Solirubrobacterales bacterium]|jgi:hypothetical protein|nr:hypothetical protein [Solirubrobacterales bacterium]